MSAPTTTGAAGDTTNPAAPVDHTTRWLTALDLLADDVRYRLPHHGIEQRLHDIADDIRATRGAP